MNTDPVAKRISKSDSIPTVERDRERERERDREREREREHEREREQEQQEKDNYDEMMNGMRADSKRRELNGSTHDFR